MKIKKSVDWAEANELLHSLAHVLEEEGRATLYNFVGPVRVDQTSHPDDLVRMIFAFLGYANSSTANYNTWSTDDD